MTGQVPVFLLYTVTSAVAFWLAADAWQRRSMPGRTQFALMMLALCQYALAAGIEYIVTTVDMKVLWSKIEYIGMVSIAPLFLLFSLAYTGQERKITRGTCILAWIMPVLTVIVAWTNELHGLLWSGFTMDVARNVLAYHPGPWFYVNVASIAIVVFAGSTILLQVRNHMQPVSSSQGTLLIAAALVPWIGILLYISRVTAGIDTSPLGFVVTGLLIIRGIKKHQLFDLVPVANESIVASMSIGVLVVDAGGRIVASNTSVRAMLGIHASDTGLPFRLALPFVSWEVLDRADGSEHRWEMHAGQDTGARWFDVHLSPLKARSGTVAGHLILFTDLTERRLSIDALSLANKKLQLMSAITRHDILNQMVAVRGFLELSRISTMPGEQERCVDNAIEAADVVSKLISFTKEYQEIGVHAPGWQGVHVIVDRATQPFVSCAISFDNDIPPTAMVFADPLVETVFYNLVENAIRHGKRVSRMRFFLDEGSKDVRVIIEDDGTGVPDKDKQRVFERGVGSGTGMGLYLSREILSMTGIAIAETGVEGGGARFEVRVPRNAFKHG